MIVVETGFTGGVFGFGRYTGDLDGALDISPFHTEFPGGIVDAALGAMAKSFRRNLRRLRTGQCHPLRHEIASLLHR